MRRLRRRVRARGTASLPAERADRLTVAFLASLLALTSACGSDDTTTAVPAPSTSTIDAASTTTASSVPLTTPFTFPPRSVTPFAPGEGTLTVTGDQQATAQFSETSCAGITVTAPRGVSASLVFVSNPGMVSSKRFVLDLAGMSAGSTTFPEPGGFNQVPARRVRLSVESIGQILTWGTTAAGDGTVTGTLTAKTGNAKSGTFELELGFTGNEGNTLPPSSHGPVQINGEWDCPEK